MGRRAPGPGRDAGSRFDAILVEIERCDCAVIIDLDRARLLVNLQDFNVSLSLPSPRVNDCSLAGSPGLAGGVVFRRARLLPRIVVIPVRKYWGAGVCLIPGRAAAAVV